MVADGASSAGDAAAGPEFNPVLAGDHAAEATRILLVRHGETSWNAEGRIQGRLDISLNEHGAWQAERTGRALADAGLAALYSSDLARARETAEAIGRSTGLVVQTDGGLQERAFGAFEGLTFDEITARWPDDAVRWRKRDLGFAPEGGELLPEFFDRCVSTVQKLARGHHGQTIAIVAHGGVLDCLYRAAARVGLNETRTWQLANASVNRLLYSTEGLTLVGWGDVSHLEAESRDDPAEIDAAPE